jgi:hypothetical protein
VDTKKRSPRKPGRVLSGICLGFAPGLLKGESGSESSEHRQHTASSPAKNTVRRQANELGRRDQPLRRVEQSIASKTSAGEDEVWACACKTAHPKWRGDKSACSTPSIQVPAFPIFQAGSRVMTGLAGCDFRIRKWERLLHACGSFQLVAERWAPVASGVPDGRQASVRARRSGARITKKWGVPAIGHGPAGPTQAVRQDCRCAKLAPSILSTVGRLPA